MTVIADELQQYAALQIVKIGLDKLCDLSLKVQICISLNWPLELEKLISEIEYINGWEQLK